MCAAVVLLGAARAVAAPTPDILRSVPPSGGATPFVSIAAERVFDATSGDPVTALLVGQTARVVVGLLNIGSAPARITGHLTGAGVSIAAADADYGTVAAGAQRTASFIVTPATCPAPAPSLAVRSAGATNTLAVPLPVSCARLPLAIVAATWDDRARGNGDGMPQAGETAAVTMRLKNTGDVVLRNVTGTLDARDASANGSARFGDIAPGRTATSLDALTVTMKRDTAMVPGECSGGFMVNGVDFASHAEVIRLGGVQGILQLFGTFHVRSAGQRTDLAVRNSLRCAGPVSFHLPSPAPAGPLEMNVVLMTTSVVLLAIAFAKRREVATLIRTRATPSIGRRRSR